MVSMTPEELTATEDACKAIEEGCKELAARIKAANAGTSRIHPLPFILDRVTGLAKTKSTPRDDELSAILVDLRAQKSAMEERLGPLRSGALVLSATDLAALDSEWTKWRAEWVRRRKIFNTYADCLPLLDHISTVGAHVS
jgi:26S proteasome regulatory subunit (ATPase 3-interacting protein)